MHHDCAGTLAPGEKTFNSALALPFLVTLLVNAIWTLWIAPNKGGNPAFKAANIACCVVMLLYGIFALACEVL